VVLRALVPAVTATVVIALVASTAQTGSVVPLEARKPDTPAVAIAAAAKAPSATQRLLIVGNSVAFSLADGFKALPDDVRPVVFNAAQPSCVFPSGVTRLRDELKQISRRPVYDCTTNWADDVQQFRPDVVLLVLGDFGDGWYEHDGRWIAPCTPEFDDWYRDSLRAAVATLGATGARVALTTAAYAYGVFGGSRFAKDDCVNQIHRDVAAEFPNTVLIDLATYVCPTPDTCRTEQDGVDLRPDGIHYMGDSALIIANWMLPELRPPG
jgi:hypothetical protein